MSYARPQDTYMHSNASQYDERYQQPGAPGSAAPGNSYFDYPDARQMYSGGHQQQQQPAYGNYADSTPGAHTAYDSPAWQQPNAAQQAAAKYSYAAPAKKGRSKWLIFGLPILVLLIAGAVIGGIFGSRAAKKHTTTGSGDGTGSTAGTTAISDPQAINAANAAALKGNADKPFSGSTDAYGNPMFLTTVNTAAPTGNAAEVVSCQDDQPNLSLRNLRTHPRLMAPGYMWNCMQERINKDGYLTLMHNSVMQNASAFDLVTDYFVDGGYNGSGILDLSREIQQRVRAWAYAYRMTNDTKYVDKTFQQLRIAAGNTTTPFGQVAPYDQHWNAQHFLDLAEMTTAYAIAYDWLYDAWTPLQRRQIRTSIINLGLKHGQDSYAGAQGSDGGWWTQTANGDGNWNCVCNSGMLVGALAVMGDDDDASIRSVYNSALTNIKANCMQAPYDDGTWAETPNYWYFGTAAQARAASAVLTATGSTEMIDVNPNLYKTGDFHMFVSGNSGLMAWGDHGPNKFSVNANALLFWGQQYKQPQQTLFQRDRADALGDPLALFWYDTSAKGAFWNGLPLDRHFDDPRGDWASMRSSWTDFNGMFLGIKSSALLKHQAHGDLDIGDFVLDAMGVRWAGEFGSGEYLSTYYFLSEAQNATRWQYFRKGTQGQNTLVLDKQNQLVTAAPTSKFYTSGTKQTGDLNFKVAAGDSAAYVTDMSSAYGAPVGSVKRGIRFLNGRRQVLLQDEIAPGAAQSSIEWRVQTNATVSISGQTATLTINEIKDPNAAIDLDIKIPARTLKVQLLSPSGAQWSTMSADTRLYDQQDPNTYPGKTGDPSNAGATTLTIQLQPGQSLQTIQTLWQPQWADLGSADSATPKNLPLDSWTASSHN